MLKKIVSIHLLFTLFTALIYGQEERSSLAVSWYPQLMIMRGLRADMDIHLGNSKSWLVIAPQYYLAKKHSGNYSDVSDDYNSVNSYKRLEGFGIELNHRIYVSNSFTPEGVYLGYGAMYGHYNLTYEDSWGYIDFMGIEAITFGLFEHETNIDKVGPNIFIGYQKRVLDKIFIDIFCGGGMRYSFIKTSALFPRNFNNDLLQFGYTGTVPLIGFRIGIVL